MATCNICKYAGRPTYKSPCSECKEFSKYEYENKKTNADRVRAMSDEELAKWICSIMTAECCEKRCPARDICNPGDNGLVKWMKQPAKED